MSEKKIHPLPMTREQSFIAAAVFFGFFVLWFLWGAVGESVICWIEKHPGMASWVQALGSLGAIFAIWWQVKTGIRFSINKERLDEKIKQEKLIRKSEILIKIGIDYCDQLLKFHDKVLAQRKEYIAFYAKKGVVMQDKIVGTSDFPSASDISVYKDFLKSGMRSFLDIPYWDFHDPELGGELLEIQQLLSALIIELDTDFNKFSENVGILIDDLKKVEIYITSLRNDDFSL